MSLDASESNNEEDKLFVNDPNGGFTLSEFLPMCVDDEGED
jgi:hypothetical protein